MSNGTIVVDNTEARVVFEKLNAVVTKLQTGETQPRSVVVRTDGHVLVGIENGSLTTSGRGERGEATK